MSTSALSKKLKLVFCKNLGQPQPGIVWDDWIRVANPGPFASSGNPYEANAL